jgi:hypothetical protein
MSASQTTTIATKSPATSKPKRQPHGPAICVPDGAGSASGQPQAVPKESQDGACRTQAPGAPPG